MKLTRRSFVAASAAASVLAQTPEEAKTLEESRKALDAAVKKKIIDKKVGDRIRGHLDPKARRGFSHDLADLPRPARARGVGCRPSPGRLASSLSCSG